MKATQMLHDLGQSLWLDNITRDILENGTLKRYIDELSVSGLTSNPTIFDHAIKNSTAYDAGIRKKVSEGKSGEALFFELAIEDLTRAADLFRPIWDRTNGVAGWGSLEVSPLLAYHTARAGQEPAARRAVAESSHQDSRPARGPVRHRGGHLRGGAHQRDAALLARALPGGGRGLHARHQPAHRGRAQSPDRLGGIALREPLGRGAGAPRARRPQESGGDPPAPPPPPR